MADTTVATASTSMAAEENAPRMQAGPLPRKRGEIGYVEEVHGAAMARMDREIAAERPTEVMGERHPADRPPESANRSTGAVTPTGNTAAQASTSATSLPRMKKPRKPLPTFGGIMLFTLLKFAAQLLLLAGTGVGWAFAVMALQNSGSSQTPDNNQNPQSQNQSGFNGPSTVIFVHVAFGVISVAELVFLERRIFRIRAERYAHVHPGEMLPRRGRYLDASMPIAPWQRPSLPSYAAALAQSGARTGDVEDALIAQPPPPAYGKTRGSTLLLQGFLTTEHQRRARLYDEEAQVGADGQPLDPVPGTPRSFGSMVIVNRPSRPASYRSHDSDWEARMDMERTRAVEEALAAMENVQQAHVSDRDRP